MNKGANAMNTLYNQDYYLWTELTAKHLEQKEFNELDLPNLIEEIKSMGSNDQHALKSNLRIVLLHLLKWQFQPTYRSNSWVSSIVEHRQRVEELLEKSPSLKPYLQEVFGEVYIKAIKGAAKQTGLPSTTFPIDCPYSLSEVLDLDYLPD